MNFIRPLAAKTLPGSQEGKGLSHVFETTLLFVAAVTPQKSNMTVAVFSTFLKKKMQVKENYCLTDILILSI